MPVAREPGLSRNVYATAIAAMLAFRCELLAAAPGTPLGPSQLVFPEQLPMQQAPAVSRDRIGNSVVVWEDRGTGAILGRRFAPDGAPLDGGFVIAAASAAAPINLRPDVAMAADGRFVVTWQANGSIETLPNGQIRRPSAVMLRRYAANGAAAGDAEPVGSAPVFEDVGPAVAVAADGDFVVAFGRRQRFPLLELQRREILVQRYAADGSKRGVPIHAGNALAVDGAAAVNGGLLNLLAYASNAPDLRVDVAMDASGDFALTWTSGVAIGAEASLVLGRYSVVGEGSFASVEAFVLRRYDASGRPRGLPSLINATSQTIPLLSQSRGGVIGEVQSEPKIAVDEDGDIVLAWSQRAYDNTSVVQPVRVRAQRFDASGTSRGPARTYAQVAASNSPFRVDVAANATGDFALAWTSFWPAQSYVQRVAGDGAARGDVIRVGADTRSPVQVAVASDPVGNFDVVWVSPNVQNTGLNVVFGKYAGP